MKEKIKKHVDKNINYIVILGILSILGINIPGITSDEEPAKAQKISVEDKREIIRGYMDSDYELEERQRQKNRVINNRIDDAQDETRELKRELIEKFGESISLIKEAVQRIRNVENILKENNLFANQYGQGFILDSLTTEK